jgi:hypothetical protein
VRNRFVLLCAVSLALTGCASMHGHHHEEESEENEVKVPFAQTPAPVQASFQRESGGAMINTVDKEMRHGKTVYEADVKMNGTNWEIVVAEDGKVVSKKIDREEDEKGEAKHEKGEKDKDKD